MEATSYLSDGAKMHHLRAIASNSRKNLPWLALGQNVQFILNHASYELYE